MVGDTFVVEADGRATFAYVGTGGTHARHFFELVVEGVLVMDNLLYLLPVLACPLGMGLMMWLMMRPKHGAQTPSGTDADRQELLRLRKEIDALRADRTPQDGPRQDHP